MGWILGEMKKSLLILLSLIMMLWLYEEKKNRPYQLEMLQPV